MSSKPKKPTLTKNQKAALNGLKRHIAADGKYPYISVLANAPFRVYSKGWTRTFDALRNKGLMVTFVKTRTTVGGKYVWRWRIGGGIGGHRKEETERLIGETRAFYLTPLALEYWSRGTVLKTEKTGRVHYGILNNRGISQEYISVDEAVAILIEDTPIPETDESDYWLKEGAI